MDPDPSAIVFEDLVWSLARQPRFLAHTHDPAKRPRSAMGTFEQSYNNAHHSVMVSRLVANFGGSPLEQLGALLHDSAEAYMGDFTAPVKAALRELGAGDALRELESRIERAIGRRFQIDPKLFHCEIVKRADLAMLASEREAFLLPRPDWDPIEHAGGFRLKSTWDPSESYRNFVGRFDELRAECGYAPRTIA